MEALILHYYLKSSKIVLIFLSISFLIYFIYALNKKYYFENNIIVINEGDSFNNIIKKNLPDINFFELILFKTYYKINNLIFEKKIHFGHFKIENNYSFIKLYKVISKPSNILNKITIVEGWTKNDLNNELSKYFDDYLEINYDEILADTYFFNKFESFDKFYEKLKNYKNKHILDYKENIFFKKFTIKELMIISSLIEKEGLDYYDKKQISSVIVNRLNKNMRLQIDATVIYALTNGNFDLNRKLKLSDLKIKHPFNTYFINGLPEEPISYVGTKTINLVLENYNTDFLFYFFDKSLNKHIFSKTYEEHKKKLNEYRNIK